MTGAEIIGTYGEELKSMAKRLKEIADGTRASIHLNVSFIKMGEEEYVGEDVFIFPENTGKEFDHDIFRVLS